MYRSGSLENGEESETHADEADAGAEPEDMGGGGLAEDEQAGCEEGANHHGGNAGFGDGPVVVGVGIVAGDELVEKR